MEVDQQEQDDLDAAYAQQEGEERRQWEERILKRSADVTERFHRENAAYEREMKELNERIRRR
jgi:hypothetical protein